MRKSHEIHETEDLILLNSQNEFNEGVTARAIVQRDSGNIILVGNSSNSEISMIGCDVMDEECDVFGLVITITSIYYDTEGHPDCFMIDPIDRFEPTESEIVAAREESGLDSTGESGESKNTTENQSPKQSNESGQSSRASQPVPEPKESDPVISAIKRAFPDLPPETELPPGIDQDDIEEILDSDGWKEYNTDTLT